MRFAAAIFVCALLGCRPAANVALDSGGMPVITTKVEAEFGDIRSVLDEVAASHAEARLHLLAATDDELVELSAADNDDLDVLVVVRVTKRDTIVGGLRSITDDDIKTSAASAAFAGKSRFAVVRADDDARITDVMRAVRALKGAGFTHTILSRRAPATRSALRSRGASPASITCSWPARGPQSPVAAAKALVQVTRDDPSGVGRVAVLNAPPGGFRQAAAFCASTAELAAGATGETVTLEVEFELGNRFPCNPPGSEPGQRGAYTPSEQFTTYGNLPSQGCDRFPR